jgi:asparagine synthase (glutamine-hydrolysing)
MECCSGRSRNPSSRIRTSAEIDAEGLAELFSQVGTGTPGHGVYRGLSQIRPGTLVRAGRDGIRESAYWRLEAREHAGDLASTAGTVRELLADIVHRQTVADVPLCSLLSGGLDSSVVSALAADSLSRRDRAKLATFSVDFTGSADAFTPDQLRPSHDEPFARAAAEYIGSRHSTITLEADDLVTAQWAPLAAHDLPTFGDMYVSFVLLCREISKQSTVALSGEAADEVFGGYPWYHVPALLAAPTFPWAARGSWEPLLRPDVRTRIRLREYAADRYAQALAEVPQLAGESPEDRRIREILYLGLTRWLPFLLDRKDRLSMACGLEVRVPFTDHRLVEYVWNVPWSMKEAGGIEKGLLRRGGRSAPRRPAPAAQEHLSRCGRPGLRASHRRAAAAADDAAGRAAVRVDQQASAHRRLRCRSAAARADERPAELDLACRVPARRQPVARTLRCHHQVGITRGGGADRR